MKTDIMSLTIGSLSGIFDGDVFKKGPFTVEIKNGLIENISQEKDNAADIDGNNKILSLPFTDGHTHLVFAGERFKELGMKLSGLSYSDILAQGGGIQHTVRQTRNATFDELLELVLERLDVFLSHGCLDVEAKSGYALSTEGELKLLEVLNQANEQHVINVHPTFGAAHVIPPDRSREEYVDEIINEMLPEVSSKNLAGTTDVFCDKGAFTVEETRRIFSASSDINIPVRVHADELEYTGIGKISASEFTCLSADHLLNAKQDDFEVLQQNNTVAMFMPLAPFGLFTDTKPTGFNNTEVQIGIGSDFNPNNWAASIQSAIRMAVFSYGLTPKQTMNAVTKGSYLGVSGNERNSLEIGTDADFLLLNAKSLSEFVSKFGQNLVHSVYKKGELVHSNNHLVV